MTPYTKQFISIAKLFVKNNACNPMLENVYLQGGAALFHDTDLCVQVPFQTGLNTCISIKEMISALNVFYEPTFVQVSTTEVEIVSGKQKVKLTVEDPSNFPLPLTTKNSFDLLGTFNEDVLAHLETALTFTSKDDLRPVMKTVHVHEHVVATDCHRLFYYPLACALNEAIQITEKAVKIMVIYGGDWTVRKAGLVNRQSTVALENTNGVTITYTYDFVRPFPDWKAILPQEHQTEMECDKNDLRKLIKTGSSFSNCVRKHCKISLNGSAKYSTSDEDFKREFEAEFDAKYNNDIVINFDYTLLDSILAKVADERIKMKISDSRRVVCINDNFLLMPLL
jgi:DNA polymerase III sliding clamp (beta) subunit (PCNA family)